jgi:hypothetical protein
MALAKRHSRQITVDGVLFRWTVRRRPTYSQGLGWTPLTFVVEHAQQPGARLVVALLRVHPGNWLGLPTRPVLPATVSAGIREALTAGWQPQLPGPPKVMTLRESGVDE